MGWCFEAMCPDCGHAWEGVQTSYRLGSRPVLERPSIGEEFQSRFCPRCYYRLYIPRSIERNVWRRWLAAFRAGPDADIAVRRRDL